MRRPRFIELLVLLTIVAYAVGLWAQSPKKVPITPNPTVASAQSEQIAVLRAQLDVMRDYQQHLLATVYWSLGAVFLLVLLVAGLNWFSSYRVYERDKEALARELRADATILNRELEAKIDNMQRSLVADINTRANQSYKAIPSVVAAQVQEKVKEVVNKFLDLKRQIARTQYEETQFRAEFFEERKNWYDAFELWIQNLEHMRTISIFWDEYHVGAVINRLSSILETGQMISYGFQERLAKVLENPPTLLTAEIKKFMSSVESAKKSPAERIAGDSVLKSRSSC